MLTPTAAYRVFSGLAAAAADARELEGEKREALKSRVLLEARRARLTAELQVWIIYTGFCSYFASRLQLFMSNCRQLQLCLEGIDPILSGFHLAVQDSFCLSFLAGV